MSPTRMICGENLLDHEMYDNWLFLNLFLFPPKKREVEKENEVVKTVFKPLLFQDPIDFHLTVCSDNTILCLDCK